MRGMGIAAEVVRAGHTNMFLSPVFAETFANVADSTVELYDTDGSQGAARGAGFGAGIYASLDQAFAGLKHIGTMDPDPELTGIYREAYAHWHRLLNTFLQER
jgi:xylulokinase